MKLVTQDIIKKINELYLELGTYAAVAREVGFSPSTVKRYVDPSYVSEKDRKIVKFEGPLPKWDSTIFRSNDWGELCELSEIEIQKIRELWKELDS